jgi:hypothetical protein
VVVTEKDELICDQCLDLEEPVVVTMLAKAIDHTFVLCGSCVRELPKGYQKV